MPTSFSKSPYASTSYSGADMLATITIKDVISHKNTTCVLGDLQTLSYSTHMERGAVRKLGNINVSDFTNGPRTIAGSLVFAVFNKHMIQPIIEGMGVKHSLLPDELPPFDATITFANEYGHSSVLRIYGIRLVNEGEVLSTNDVYIENTYQYVAQNIEVLKDTELDQYIPQENMLNPSYSDTGNVNTGNIQSPNINDFVDTDYNAPEGEEHEAEIISHLDAYYTENGYVKFSIVKMQPSLIVSIINEKNEEIKYAVDVISDTFYKKLASGNYAITLEKEDGTRYNTVSLNVTPAAPESPYVLDITATSIRGGVTQSDITKVISIAYDGEKQETDIINMLFEFTQLEPGAKYQIAAVNIDSLISDMLEVTTMSNALDIYDGFSEFIKQTELNQQETLAVIESAKDIKKPFIEALNEAIQSKTKRLDTEELMHLASYYDLAIKQKSYNFKFSNKWLCEINAGDYATNFKVYGANGIMQNANALHGLIRYQQLHNQTLEKLVAYRPSSKYQIQMRSKYAANSELQESMKESYNARYGLMPIHFDYDYYDYSLNAHGAYIELLDVSKMVAHYSTDEAYFVFKEDLSTNIAFKVKAIDVIDYRKLDFFDDRNNYIVYLESNNQPISKSVRILNGKAEYSYGTILSYALDRRMQDFARELCIEQQSMFEMFCTGFYLLVNRKQLSSDYIKLFDALFYSYTKENRVRFAIQNDYLYFDKQVDCLLFDKLGNYIEKRHIDKIKIPLSGYMVWFTSTNMADCLNFENL